MRTKYYKNTNELEAALHREITTKITLSIQEFGDARILLSGGNTPKSLYEKIAKTSIDWSKVIIGLIDDRNVELSSEHSNERMLRETFSKPDQKGPKIIGMVGEKMTRSKIEKRYADFFERIDYTLLGMGDDGHTASLFPNDIQSESSLRHRDKGIIFTTAPSFPKDRISCSRGLIISSQSIGLMIRGEKKLAVLEEAEQHLLPISYFTNACQQLTTYYSKL
ncbi:MAG: 6-phosphogluconolactonase [Crocinitomicaceae bacterium]|nr:6-phosphogluconolactonase [Flavobacteriales bacterium]NQZ34387.1 6-phosphogluconolactonase [Crocinitomicaceae bacterium]